MGRARGWDGGAASAVSRPDQTLSQHPNFWSPYEAQPLSPAVFLNQMGRKRSSMAAHVPDLVAMALSAGTVPLCPLTAHGHLARPGSLQLLWREGGERRERSRQGGSPAWQGDGREESNMQKGRGRMGDIKLRNNSQIGCWLWHGFIAYCEIVMQTRALDFFYYYYLCRKLAERSVRRFMNLNYTRSSTGDFFSFASASLVFSVCSSQWGNHLPFDFKCSLSLSESLGLHWEVDESFTQEPGLVDMDL